MDIISGLFAESSAAEHKLGELFIDPFGRKFRYVQNGAVALTTGHLLQEAAEDTNYRSMAVQAAVDIGDLIIPVTLGGTAVTANQFENGDLVVESSTGIGQVFKIVGHDVQTSTTGTCNFTVDRPVKIALTTSSQVSVRKSSYDGVVSFPTTPTGAPVGIALIAMTIAYYGWVQSGGDGVALFDNQTNTSADVTRIIPSRDVAGSVSVDVETYAAAPTIGFAREQVSVDSTMGFVHLQID